MDDGLFGVDRRSVIFAQKHAAETIGKMRRADGSLADDPDNEWRINEPSRKKIHDALVSLCNGGMDYRKVTEIIMQATGFARDKAELLAHHEIMTINAASSLQSLYEAQSTGLNVKKSWLADKTSCLICQANTEAGSIALDAPFPSGHVSPPAHYGCRCVLLSEIEPNG